MHADEQIDILEILRRRGIDFIVIGGVAAALQGAPVVTLDTDIVHARTEDNVSRLLGALAELDAYYREHPDWKPRPEAKWLLGRGHHLLMTSRGPLDVLGVLTQERDYDALCEHSEWVEIASGVQVRVLTLQMLIELKEELHRDKDRAVLPVLRATQREREQRQQGS